VAGQQRSLNVRHCLLRHPGDTRSRHLIKKSKVYFIPLNAKATKVRREHIRHGQHQQKKKGRNTLHTIRRRQHQCLSYHQDSTKFY
jgi:hypothetical protein